MRNWIKNVDIDQMKDQIAEMKEQIQDMRFRKPWSKGEDSSPILYTALGAALAWAAFAIYSNRNEVANFCSNCGAKLKSTWEQSGFKEKAEQMMGKGKDGRTMTSAGAGSESLY